MNIKFNKKTDACTLSRRVPLYKHDDLTASSKQLCKYLWDGCSIHAYVRHFRPSWVDSCNSSELCSVLSEWMKRTVAAGSPNVPLDGLEQKDKKRALTKPLGDEHYWQSKQQIYLCWQWQESLWTFNLCLTCLK